MTALLASLALLAPLRFAFPHGASLDLPRAFHTVYGVEAVGDETAELGPRKPRTVPDRAMGEKSGATLVADRGTPQTAMQHAWIQYGPNFLHTGGRLDAATARRLKPAPDLSPSKERTKRLLGTVDLADLPITRVEPVTVDGRPGGRVRYETRRDRDGYATSLGQVAAIGPSGRLFYVWISSGSPKADSTASVDAAIDASLRRLVAGWRWKASSAKGGVRARRSPRTDEPHRR